MVKELWQLKAEKCRQILKNSLNPAWLLSEKDLPPADQLDVSTFVETSTLLTPKELSITKLTATELVAQMASGSLTAVETATAFLKRAHLGHQLLNFATEFLVDEALARAAELDAHFKATGKLVGPLHGVPISIKEHIGLKGRICHSAYIAWTDNIASEDALLVRCLRAAGAIIHVRTNEPQSLMVRGMIRLDSVLAWTTNDLSARGHEQYDIWANMQPLQPEIDPWRIQWRRRCLYWLPLCCHRHRHRHWRLSSHSRRLLWSFRTSYNGSQKPI